MSGPASLFAGWSPPSSQPDPGAPLTVFKWGSTLNGMNLTTLTSNALAGEPITRADAIELLGSDHATTMSVVAAAAQVRNHFFARRIKLNYLVSLKSGLCSEDCSYCSQAIGSTADVLTYPMIDQSAAQQAAQAGVQGGAHRLCLVASGRSPSWREVNQVAGVIESIKTEHPDVEVCACLGQLDAKKAERLKQAGADSYNHNLNTNENRYADICTTHSYDDRVETIRTVKQQGLSSCAGLIVGMGESDAELVDTLIALRELDVDSVPVNFLLPFEGTPLAGHLELTPWRALLVLAVARLLNPATELRAAAGREYHLRELQGLALEVVDSIFLGDYPTTEGAAGADDLAMIRSLGFEAEGLASAGADLAGTAVPIRRRGVGASV